jgi:putative membrane protein
MPEGEVIFRMSPQRVLISGLFNFSLVWVAGLFGLLQTFEPLIPFDIRDPGRWLGLVDAGAERFTLGAIAAVLLLALALGVISGLVSTLGRDWNFRLSSEGERLRRTSGLLTRREAVIPKRRVQLALLRTGPLRARFGIAQLLLQTLGSSKGQGGLQSAAPFARSGEIDRIVAELPRLRLPGDTPLQRVSSRHILRVAIRVLLLPAGVILGAASRRPEALALLALLPIFLAGAVLQRNFHLYGVADGLLFVQESFWKRRLWAVPMASAQSVSIRRSWLQRRLGLATVTIDTAGAPVLGGPRIVDVRLELALQLRRRILEARPA